MFVNFIITKTFLGVMDQDFKNLNYLLILTAIKVRSIEIRAPYVVDHIFKFSELFTVKFEKDFRVLVHDPRKL